MEMEPKDIIDIIDDLLEHCHEFEEYFYYTRGHNDLATRYGCPSCYTEEEIHNPGCRRELAFKQIKAFISVEEDLRDKRMKEEEKR